MSTHRVVKTLPLQTRFYYGWIIVCIAALGMFFSGPGQTFTISVFIDPYIQEFGWSRSQVSGTYSAATLSAGLLLFVIGRMADRFGLRATIVTVASLLGVACLWNSMIANLAMLFVGFFMIRLFGQGSMPMLSQTLVPQWFIKRRGRALSFTMIGIAISSASLPPLNTWLIETWGWPAAWRFWALLLLFFFVPLAYVFVRNRPEDIGLLPDAEVKKKTAEANDEASDKKENWTLKEAKKTSAFWLMLFCVAVPALVNTAVIFHFVSIFAENGLSKGLSALVLSIMAIVAFPCTFIAGFMVERLQVNRVFAFAFFLQCLVLALLLFCDNAFMAVLFGIIRGVVQGIESICMGIIWPDYFGRRPSGFHQGSGDDHDCDEFRFRSDPLRTCIRLARRVYGDPVAHDHSSLFGDGGGASLPETGEKAM